MGDLYLGIAIMVVFPAGMFVAARRIGGEAPRVLCDLLARAVVLSMLLYIRDVWDKLLLVKVLPFSNLIVVGNWFPPAVSFLAGLAWQRVPGNALRRTLSAGALLLIGGFSLYEPLSGETPVCGNVWSGRVSRQTTRATCSAACAATLLQAHGIPATEQEMARLCLTHRGTHWKGLYRGLKLKTAGTEWDVEPFTCSLNELSENLKVAVILTVRMDEDNGLAPYYREEAGWVPGQSHSTVLFESRSDNLYEIGDPSVGPEQWTFEDMKMLWHGEGMRLVPRRPAL